MRRRGRCLCVGFLLLLLLLMSERVDLNLKASRSRRLFPVRRICLLFGVLLIIVIGGRVRLLVRISSELGRGNRSVYLNWKRFALQQLSTKKRTMPGVPLRPRLQLLLLAVIKEKGEFCCFWWDSRDLEADDRLSQPIKRLEHCRNQVSCCHMRTTLSRSFSSSYSRFFLRFC